MTFDAQKPSEIHGLNEGELRSSLWWVFITVIPAGIFYSVLLGGATTLLTQLQGLSDRAFGVVAALPFATTFLQIPASVCMEHAGNRKKLMVAAAVSHRLLWIPIAAMPILFGHSNRAILMFILLIGLSHALGNISGPAWQSLMADLVPAARRGRYFARRAQLFHASLLAGSLVIAAVLPADVLSPSMGLILFTLFTVAALAGGGEMLCYLLVKDPPPAHPRERRHWLADLLTPLRDTDFRPFLWFGMFNTAGAAIIGPFMWKHFLNELSVSPLHSTLVLQAAPLLAVILISPLWGNLLDRIGRKPTLRIGVVGGAILSFGWFFITPEIWWAGIFVAILIQFFWNAVDQTNFLMTLKYTARSGHGGAKGGNATYAATFNLGCAVAGVMAGVFGGDLAERCNNAAWLDAVQTAIHPAIFNQYLLLLLLSIVLRLSGLVLFMPGIKDPGAVSTRQAIQTMASMVFASLQQVLVRPGRERGGEK